MAGIFLSGVGGSANWLPLILPLVAIVGILTLFDAIAKYIKKRRLLRENRLVNALTSFENNHISNEKPE